MLRQVMRGAYVKTGKEQRLARPVLQFRDRGFPNPSLNIVTKTINLVVLVMRPRL